MGIRNGNYKPSNTRGVPVPKVKMAAKMDISSHPGHVFVRGAMIAGSWDYWLLWAC